MIDRAALCISRIVSLAQRRPDAGRHCRRDAPNMTRGGTVNMAAENCDDPPGMLQGPAQIQHDFPGLEVKPLRPHGHLEWRVVGKYRDGFGGLGVD